jgi:hypothetical protein
MDSLYNSALQIIPIQDWLTPGHRNQWDRQFGTAFGPYGYSFTAIQQKQLQGLDILADGVLQKISHETDMPFQAKSFQNQNPDGSFSDGFLLFAGPERHVIDMVQPGIIDRINQVARHLGSTLRLEGPRL